MMSSFPFPRPLAFGAAALVVGLGAAPALACPDFSLSGALLNFTSDQLWAPQSVEVVAGGDVDLGACPMPGHGYVITAPDFDLSYDDNGAARELEIRVEAACDTVLLVNDASGNWHFNDDDEGSFNPVLRLAAAPSGAYDIWVGTYEPATCAAVLTFETFGNPPGSVGNGVLNDPGNLMEFRTRINETLTFNVTADPAGPVWGSGVYTDDSALAAAVIHAGLLQPGETGTVEVTILPGQQSYQGSARNGVQTADYGVWDGSYTFPAAPPMPAQPEPSK